MVQAIKRGTKKPISVVIVTGPVEAWQVCDAGCYLSHDSLYLSHDFFVTLLPCHTEIKHNQPKLTNFMQQFDV